jgi:catechol 2,3-dioxygenase-like lactoylglutathione lyase family enzyme
MENFIYWAPLVPELTVTSLQASLEFYEALGFKVRFKRSSPEFAYLELGQVQLMLEEFHENGWNVDRLQKPFGRGINLQIEVQELRAIVASLSSLQVPLFRGFEEKWYRVSDIFEEGQSELLVQDPDGYLLRFMQPLGRRTIRLGV